MPDDCVIDTCVLQKANAPLNQDPNTGSQMEKRIHFFKRLLRGNQIILISSQLTGEYRKQVRAPRNDLIRAFLELLTSGTRARVNYSKLTGSQKDFLTKIRYPKEDIHLVRTAYNRIESWIITEEERVLNCSSAVYRQLRIHIQLPWHQ